MTYKSIVENMVEREARHMMERIHDDETRWYDFGVVDMQSKDKLFQNFAVDLERHDGCIINAIRVIGFISAEGFITCTHWRYTNDEAHPYGWNKF